ncbi:hypothetical protein B4099_1902 [Heyndrickxia coagulans]|uniref:Uncharacterized protein n=1 Tax=Heyndrickxia coagulans TaxID=1398 RepID=A0A150K0V7_HEYCO|nr:hypothetical protein B4099_1902 [Heyndrickxia coagulans]
MTNLADNLYALNVLCPFKYFSYQDIVNGDGHNPLNALLVLLLIAAFSACTYCFTGNGT